MRKIWRFRFEILQFLKEINGYVSLNNLTPCFVFVVVVIVGTALSCISSVDSLSNLFFSYFF